MILAKLAPHAHKLRYLVNENSPTILTVVGVAGTVATAYLTGRATVKATRELDLRDRLTTEHRAVHGPEDENEPDTKREKIEAVWKEYIPAVSVGVITVGCIIMANRISSKRIAALVVASGISERALQEYKAKVVEKFGERKHQDIHDEIAQDRVNNSPVSSQVVVVGTGQVLCYDMSTGRYFQSTIETIKKAENKINHDIIHFMSVSLSEFYDEIGLPPTSYSDSVGWNTDNLVEVVFSTTMSPDDRPCITIDFSRAPIAEYNKPYG
jgi:Family of unknown function (DUF6353)